MLKKILIAVAVAAAALFILYRIQIAYTKSHSPFELAKYNADGLELEVKYCRPFKKGRVIFGELVPFGEVWRTGANEATQITLNKKVTFGGMELDPGVYELFTLPDKYKWTVIVNGERGQWGAFDYKPESDVLRVEVPSAEIEKELEQLTIAFEKSGDDILMRIMWDRTGVAVPIRPA